MYKRQGFKYLHSYNGNLYVWNCFVMVYSYQKENSKQNRQTRANQRRIKDSGYYDRTYTGAVTSCK